MSGLQRVDRGLAGGFDILDTISAEAMRRRAPVTRPGLLIDRHTPPTDYGIECAARLWTPYRRLYMSPEDVGLVIAGPRRGKTQQVANTVIDASGSAVVTSTRADIYALTAPLRSGLGDVHVMNPHGLGGIRSTLRFDLLGPCARATEAGMRAGHLLTGGGSTEGVEDAEYWEGNAHIVLRCVLHAAAISPRRDMRDVYRWALNWNDTTPVDILKRNKAAAPGWGDELASAYDANKGEGRTAKSIIAALRLALAFMAHAETARLVLPAEDGDHLKTFDPAEFILGGDDAAVRPRNTLYLLGADVKHSGIGPLFAAVTASLFETGKLIASLNMDMRAGQTGRLDPPLYFCLDEAALICTVPLDRWTSESGGAGMPILISVQSTAHLEKAWGRLGTQMILNNTQMLVVHGGGNDVDVLRDWSTLFGNREQIQRSRSAHTQTGGTTTTTNVVTPPIITLDRLNRLPKGQCVVKYMGGRPVIGRARMAYKRRDVRAAADRLGIEAPRAFEDHEDVDNVADMSDYRKALT